MAIDWWHRHGGEDRIKHDDPGTIGDTSQNGA